MTDEQFFSDHPTRQAHIRRPTQQLNINPQRAVRYLDECELEFRSLGAHAPSRRRVLLWRVPPDNAFYNPDNPQILKIPFLAFSDETIEDDDSVLLPIIHEIMMGAAK